MTSRIAFVFPGQGSHRAGMASAWLPEAGPLFEELSDATGLDLPGVADDADACGATAVGQPSIAATSLAALQALTEAGLRPDVVAGHSLGEVTAAIAAGVLRRDHGAGVIAARGRAFGQACRVTPGAMAAVVKLPVEQVELLVDTVPDAVVANVNAPEQAVVAGSPEAVEELGEKLRDAGARVLPLPVEGAFHSPAMSPAVVALSTALRWVPLQDPTVPLVSGLDGHERTTAEGVRSALVDGVLAPVRWVDVHRSLVARGVELAIEVGPGGVLAGLARRTDPQLTVVKVATPEDVPAALDAARQLEAVAA